MNDSFRHKGMRKRLVAAISQKGISDKAVLKAINTIPRHFFLEKAFEEQAYEDKAFPIDELQTISHPYTVAYQSQLLGIQKRDKVLEIGTGSGYQASILATLGARVYTVERHRTLYIKAQQMFKHLGLLGIRSYHADGYIGLGEFAPFDKILVTAAAPNIPETLLQQLKIGGILVIPVGEQSQQQMLRITRVAENDFKQEKFDHFRFVPMLPGKN